MNQYTDSPRLSQVNNWRDIDTTESMGHGLNTAIAYRLGWRVQDMFDDVDFMASMKNNTYRWVLRKPSGEIHFHLQSERFAWECMGSQQPDYCNNLSAAWTLVPDMQSGFYFYLSNTGTPARCRVQHNGENIVDEIADTPSLAVCYAWLTWHDVNGGQS